MRYISTALIVALGLLLGACGTESTVAAGEGGRPSPIAEFLGTESFFGDREAAQAELIEQERARQEVIAACMLELGFEYIPMDPEQFFFFEADADGLEFNSEEWIAKYGFGITTQRFSQEEVGPDLVGFDDSRFREQMESDPNRAIVEAMSEAEREAYYEALYGGDDAFPMIDEETMSDEEIEAELDEFDFQPSGCEGEAYAADPINRFYQDFNDELEDMHERIEADPRIAEAGQEVSDCVAAKGYDYSGSMEDVYEQFEDELQSIESQVGFPGEDLTEEDFAELSDEELEAIFNTPRELPDDALARLAELQEQEIALAVAVQECGGGFDAQHDLYTEVAAEYEQQFLDENADRLAGYGAE